MFSFMESGDWGKRPIFVGHRSKVPGVVPPGEKEAQGGPYCFLHTFFFFFLPYYLNCGWSKVEDSPFPQITSDRIRGNVLKLQEGRFKLDLRKIFFIERVVKPWNTLVRDLPFHQEKILGLCWIYSLKLKSPSLPVLSGWMQSCIRQRIIESFRSEEISRIIKLNLWHISGFSL